MLRKRGFSKMPERGRSLGTKKRPRSETDMDVDDPEEMEQGGGGSAVGRSKSRLASLVRSRSKGPSAVRQPGEIGLKNKKVGLSVDVGERARFEVGLRSGIGTLLVFFCAFL